MSPDPLERLEAALRRHRRRHLEAAPGERRAGVLVPVLAGGDEPRLLLERRSRDLPNHAGQIGFPGGGIEPADGGSPEAAALRETWEEVGIPPAAVVVLGRLGDVRTPTGYVITPVVGRIPPGTRLRPEPGEVDGLVLVPLRAVAAPGAFRMVRRKVRGVLLHGPALLWDGREIWGATARILLELRRLLLPRGHRLG